MKRFILLCLFLSLCLAGPAVSPAQTYYYPGGSISQSDLRNSRPYKKGTYLLQGNKRGIIWIPKHDARGNRYLELLMEHFLQGAEIKDFSTIQMETIVGGTHGLSTVLSLLMDLEARDMLGVTKEQGEKINELFVEYRKRLGDRMLVQQRANPRASNLEVAMVRASEMEHLTVWLQARLLAVLTPEQFQQAKEMVFQLVGGFQTAVVDLQILSLFELSREQREKLELIAEDANEKRNKIFTIQNSTRLEARDYQAFDAAMGELALLVSTKIQRVMTAEQIEKAKQLGETAPAVRKKMGLDE